jgi:ATP-dependent DNA helicase RecQ
MLDQIAEAKGLAFSELLTELEMIVNSGTKLDIDYYIEDVIDEEKQDEIYDYFCDAETDDIDEALSELGEDEFSEEEVRLMRLKFLSELAN